MEEMTNPDPEVRADVARSLSQTGDPRALEALRVALRDPDPEVRVSVVTALVYFKAEPQADLIRALSEDPEPAVRAAAARTLGTIEGHSALEALEHARSDEARVVRKAVAQVLREQRLKSRVAEDPEAELRIFERLAGAYDRTERRLGARAAWLLLLLVLKPLLAVYLRIRDVASGRLLRRSRP
jgi:HEAT repeat protein